MSNVAEPESLNRSEQAIIWRLTLAYVAGTGDDLRTCYARAMAELQRWLHDRDEGEPMGWRAPDGSIYMVRAQGEPILDR